MVLSTLHLPDLRSSATPAIVWCLQRLCRCCLLRQRCHNIMIMIHHRVTNQLVYSKKLATVYIRRCSLSHECHPHLPYQSLDHDLSCLIQRVLLLLIIVVDHELHQQVKIQQRIGRLPQNYTEIRHHRRHLCLLMLYTESHVVPNMIQTPVQAELYL